MAKTNHTGNEIDAVGMIIELRMLLGGRSMAQCGREWGVDRREISAVIRGRQRPGDRLLAVMGLEAREEKRLVYIRVNRR